mgnify:CR=1 FL=1
MPRIPTLVFTLAALCSTGCVWIHPTEPLRPLPNGLAEARFEKLDVDFAQLKQGFIKYLPVGVAVGVVVLAELGMVAIGWSSAPSAADAVANPIIPQMSNTAALGQILYTKYVIFFQASALVLLTAMIGAIVLTLHHKPNIKRQKIEEQNARTRENVIEIKKVPFRTGV